MQYISRIKCGQPVYGSVVTKGYHWGQEEEHWAMNASENGRRQDLRLRVKWQKTKEKES